jgi:hypothetical protein
MRRVNIALAVMDDEDEDYYRAVWYLAGALTVLGVRNRVVPTLCRLFDEALKQCQDGGCPGAERP